MYYMSTPCLNLASRSSTQKESQFSRDTFSIINECNLTSTASIRIWPQSQPAVQLAGFLQDIEGTKEIPRGLTARIKPARQTSQDMHQTRQPAALPVYTIKIYVRVQLHGIRSLARPSGIALADLKKRKIDDKLRSSFLFYVLSQEENNYGFFYENTLHLLNIRVIF